MLNDALKMLREKMRDHIDAKDTERASLLSWPSSPKIQVDGDPYPYEADKLVFADYLNEQELQVTLQVEQGPIEVQGSTIKGKMVVPSPLKSGDRLIVSRMSDQRYYIHGKAGG